VKEPGRLPPAEESRTGETEGAGEKGAPDRFEESEKKDPVRNEETGREAKTAEKAAGKGDETGAASAAGQNPSPVAGRKERADAKAADAGRTLLKQKEALDGILEAEEAAAAGIAEAPPKAGKAEAELLSTAEATEGAEVSGKEGALQYGEQALQVEANPLPHPSAKGSAQLNQVKESAGAGERSSDRRAGRFETASSGRGEESRPALELVDLRRAGRAEADARHSGGGGENTEARASMPGNQLSAENGQVVRQEVMVLETPGGRNEASGLRGETLPSRAAEELARALREGGNSEILKRARITLKDANQGEIRLILKPERLGEVQIRLNLSDRHIAGRIIVENSSVREVFQENMEALNRAFRESGYQSAGLEVSVGGREGSFGRPKERAGGARSAARGAAMLDEQVPRVHSDQYAMSRINVYV
jgi:flagellar hook-length control protein FliK